MRLSVLTAFAMTILVTGHAANAQRATSSGWQDQLTRTLVRTERGQFLYEDRALCEFKPKPGWPGAERKLQIRSSATAPANAVSRDTFLFFVATWEAQFLQQMTGTGTRSCQLLNAPIGNIDLELIMTLTEEGFQLEVKNTQSGESNRSTQTWADYYGE